MKRIIYLVSILCVFVLSILVLFGCNSNNNLIGGQKDTHGCLGPAGYSYNETANSCIRPFEIDADARKAAGIVVGYIGYVDGLTIIEVVKGGCDGCYTITFDKNNERMKASVGNWKVSEVVLV